LRVEDRVFDFFFSFVSREQSIRFCFSFASREQSIRFCFSFVRRAEFQILVLFLAENIMI